MNKPKLYVSSTFFDLKDHREALIETLRKTQCFDLECMEDYGSRSQDPLTVCRNGVQAADIYILLLGHRYGYIPDGQKYSITHLEYKAAIGDADDDPSIGGTPNRVKIVLPFMLAENYRLPDEVVKLIDAEEKKDGEELTKEKKSLLQAWKDKVGKDFLIDRKRFTTPTELPGQVLAALINALMATNNTAVLQGLKLPPDFVYRCNRERPRRDFLSANLSAKDFYRLFFIHGETNEMPVIFSNNLSMYELPQRKEVPIDNLPDNFSNVPAKFVENVVQHCHKNIFTTTPENLVTFKDLADAIIKSDLSMIVVKMVIDYNEWQESYKTMLKPFLEAIKEANKTLGPTSKAAYLLVNIRYFSQDDKIRQKPPAGVVLEKLASVKPSDVDQWVRTYFYQNTRKDIEANNDSEVFIENFRKKYFPDFGEGKSAVNMFVTIDRLKLAVQHFNNNQYQGIFNQ